MLKESPTKEKPGQMSKLDEEFVRIMTEIDKRYSEFSKHDRIKVEQWSKKLCQVSVNTIWKQNRNLYALLLLDSVIEGSLKDPFNKFPPENYLPSLNKNILKDKLDVLRHKLAENKIPIYENYLSSPKVAQHQRIGSAAIPRARAKVDVRSVRNLSGTYRGENDENKNSISMMSGLSCLGNQSRHPSTERRREQQPDSSKILSPSTKYNYYGINTPLPPKDVSERRKMQAQLDLSQIKIDTLKEELETKFEAVTKLNKTMEKMNEDVKRLQTERGYFSGYLENVKGQLRDGSILFRNEEAGRNFIDHINELCDIFSVPSQKLKSNQIHTVNNASSRVEEPPKISRYYIPAMKKHSSTEDIALKHYYNSMHSNKSSRDLIKNSMHTTKDTKRVEFSVDTKQAQETKLSTQESRDYNEEFNVYKPASEKQKYIDGQFSPTTSKNRVYFLR